MAISLVSINIENSRHLDLVLPFIRSARPDVLCLQEVMENDIPLIQEAMGTVTFVFLPMAIEQREVHTCPIGVAIFSRISDTHYSQWYYHDAGPIRMLDESSLETRNETQSRGVAECLITQEGIEYRIGTTHLTWTPRSQISEYQRKHLDALLQVLSTKGDYVLVGDFNMSRGTELFSHIASEYTDNIPLEYKTSLDVNIHRSGKDHPEQIADKMVDGLFTRGYRATNVTLHSGVSDHCAITATIEKIGQ